MIDREPYTCDCDIVHMRNRETTDMLVLSCKNCGDKTCWEDCPECGGSKVLLYYDSGGKCMSCGYSY